MNSLTETINRELPDDSVLAPPVEAPKPQRRTIKNVKVAVVATPANPVVEPPKVLKEGDKVKVKLKTKKPEVVAPVVEAPIVAPIVVVDTPTITYDALMKEVVELRQWKAEMEAKIKKDKEAKKLRAQKRRANGGVGKAKATPKTGLDEETVRRIAREEAQKVNDGSTEASEDEDEDEE